MRDDVHVTAVDVKADYLDDTRRFFDAVGLSDRAEFREEDLTRLRLEGPFDLILSVDVMEHIEDDRAVFGHFHRVLAAGGHVIVNTPSDLGGSAVRALSRGLGCRGGTRLGGTGSTWGHGQLPGRDLREPAFLLPVA